VRTVSLNVTNHLPLVSQEVSFLGPLQASTSGHVRVNADDISVNADDNRTEPFYCQAITVKPRVACGRSYTYNVASVTQQLACGSRQTGGPCSEKPVTAAAS